MGVVARRRGVSRDTVLRVAQRGEVRPAGRAPDGYLRFHPAVVAAYATRLSAWSPPVGREEASTPTSVDA